MDCRRNVCARPVKNFLQLRPVVDSFEILHLHRCSSYDKTVVVVLFDVVERFVEFLKVLPGCVCPFVTLRQHEVELNLQRRV